MQVDEDKDHRGAVRMEVAEEVPAGNIGHNMLNGSERSLYVGGVMHR